jgi:hypothetical protein
MAQIHSAPISAGPGRHLSVVLLFGARVICVEEERRPVREGRVTTRSSRRSPTEVPTIRSSLCSRRRGAAAVGSLEGIQRYSQEEIGSMEDQGSRRGRPRNPCGVPRLTLIGSSPSRQGNTELGVQERGQKAKEWLCGDCL